jgi:proteasome alpha subunit
LVKPGSIEKIFKIDDHIGGASCGLIADARILVERARVAARNNEILYNEKIPVRLLVKYLCDFKQGYTQYAAVRPFGVAFLIAGVDGQGSHLFATGPSGAFVGYKAHSEGRGRKTAMAFFESTYKDHLSVDEALSLGIRALRKGVEGTLDPDAVAIAIVDSEHGFRKLSRGESKNRVKEVIG